MLFVDPFFLLVFLPLTLGAFAFAGKGGGRGAALATLLIASLIFYFRFEILFGFILLASILINFAVAVALLRLKDCRITWRVWAFALGLTYNFGTLISFKYLGFFAQGFGDERLALADLTIPMGISFYTFHQAVFLMDAYSRQQTVLVYFEGVTGNRVDLARALTRYAAFICFFPQLVIGPIVYLSEFAPSVLSRNFGKLRRVDLEVGITLVCIGLFKKLVIADRLAPLSASTFDASAAGAPLSSFASWLGVLAYYAQLYFDFSGYSDIAVGLARLFSIPLPINFDSPLRASGIADFYKRWHITLTRVIARFIFTPFSLWGARRSVDRSLHDPIRLLLTSWLPLFLNFVVIALWHGAKGTFVLFGVIHGLWFIGETEMKRSKSWRAWHSRVGALRVRRVGQLLTCLPLMLTFALFGSRDLVGFGNLLIALLGQGQAGGAVSPSLRDLLWIVAAFTIIWLFPNSYELLSSYRPGIRTWSNPSTTPTFLRLRWRPTLPWAAFLALLIATSFWYMGAKIPFLYQGF